LVAAEDHLRRRIEPLDNDLASWIGFTAAYNLVGEPLLDEHGLRPTDIGRLQRHWQHRIEADAGLRAEAENLPNRHRLRRHVSTPSPLC
jgi:hypothetical protein